MTTCKPTTRKFHLYGLISTILIASVLLAACDQILGEDEPVIIPTVADMDFNQFQTALVFTANAPPTGFDTIAFPEVDDNLITTVYSRFEINVYFDGYDSNTAEALNGYMRLQSWNDEQHVSRQVKIEFVNDVFSGGSSNLDIVRISNDYYMLDANGICTYDPALIGDIANLRAGQLIGGIQFAQPTGRKEVVNNLMAWQYGFDPQFVNGPAVEFAEETSVFDLLTGEIWVNPEHNIVLRYAIEMNVHKARLLFGNREVTGRLRYQYDVHDIGIQPNISIPNGC